jgi:hypothetical protein
MLFIHKEKHNGPFAFHVTSPEYCTTYVIFIEKVCTKQAHKYTIHNIQIVPIWN